MSYVPLALSVLLRTLHLAYSSMCVFEQVVSSAEQVAATLRVPDVVSVRCRNFLGVSLV